MSELTDLTDEEYNAISALDPRTEDVRTEFAVVYYQRGKPVASGPYQDRHIAENVARSKRGVIAERTVTTDFGFWTPSDPRGHV